MRRPTPPEISHKWWRDALAGRAPALTTEPQCGFFARPLVKGGVLVEARIWLRQRTDESGELIDDEVLLCEVAGTLRDVDDQWLWLAKRPIPEAEFEFLRASRMYGARGQGDLFSEPRRPVDMMTTKPPF